MVCSNNLKPLAYLIIVCELMFTVIRFQDLTYSFPTPCGGPFSIV